VWKLPKPTQSVVRVQSQDPDPQHALEFLDEARESAAGALLALAFRDNPINRAVIGPDRHHRLVVNTYGMATSLVATRRYSFRRVVLAESGSLRGSRSTEVSGALIALDPGGYPAAAPPLATQLRCLWGQGVRVLRRWTRLYRMLDACHPKEPHCYLSLIAIHPALQRNGIGRALLQAWLRDVDARAMASYLETDRCELLGFYQAAGFCVEHELEAFGTPIWCMSRPAMNDPG
jgi:ribosomal protein S18 acetylase RimI-like enzyme